MPAFEQGEIVRVPFPYTDKDRRQHRPALVVSFLPVGENGALLWVAMITLAENRAWPGDVQIANLKNTGLPAPSVIRTAKLATIEARYAERRGAIDKATLASALHHISATIFGASL